MVEGFSSSPSAAEALSFPIWRYTCSPSLACTTGSQPLSNLLCDCCRGRSAPIGAWWFVGVSSGGGTPGPFSNPAVKPACADGTWLATALEGRSSPSSLSLPKEAPSPAFLSPLPTLQLDAPAPSFC